MILSLPKISDDNTLAGVPMYGWSAIVSTAWCDTYHAITSHTARYRPALTKSLLGETDVRLFSVVTPASINLFIKLFVTETLIFKKFKN